MKSLTKTIVYKATTPSKKLYFGITTQKLEKRIRQHFLSAKKKRHINPRWENALNKYGNAIIWEIVEICDSLDKALSLEISLIEQYKSYEREFGYNGTKGGDCNSIYAHLPETKIKISKTRKLKGIISGQNLREWQKQNPGLQSKNIKMAYKNNPNLRENSRQTMLKLVSLGKIHSKTPVVLKKENDVIKFDSVAEAAKFLNVPKWKIRHRLKKNSIAINGYYVFKALEGV